MSKTRISLHCVRQAREETVNSFLPPGLRGLKAITKWEMEEMREWAAGFDVEKELKKARAALVAKQADTAAR